jgi:thioredoxin reductase (NADPH)
MPPKPGLFAETRRADQGGNPADQLRIALRALVVAEAELGERIMRALVLLRVALIERAEVWRCWSVPLAGLTCWACTVFWRPTATSYYPRPKAYPEAMALVALHRASASDMPPVVDGSNKRNPTLREGVPLACCQPDIDSEMVNNVAVVGAGPA